MTQAEIARALEDLIEQCEQVSRDDDGAVEAMLREGAEHPLTPAEAEELLNKVVEQLRAGVQERGDLEGERAIGNGADTLILEVVEVRRRLAEAVSPSGRAPTADRLELKGRDGIEPHPVFPRRVFHEQTIDMQAGFVRLDDLRLWDGNERLAIHLEQFERDEGRPPEGREVLEIMTTRMRLPGVTQDDEFEIAALARSIASNGVRQPPVIGLDGTLYDGNRRIAACYEIRGSDDFTSEQKRRVEWIYVWQLTEHALPDDVDRLLMALNFEPDLKKEWPKYVKARKIYNEWRTMLDLEEGSPGPRREAQLKRELSMRFALGPETSVVNRFIKMVEAANEFEAHHVEVRHRDPSEVRHHAAENFEYFDELSKGVRAGGVSHALGMDEGLRALVFDLLYEDKFAKWSDIRKLRYVPDNIDARRKLEAARELVVDPDDSTTSTVAQKEVGLALSIGEAAASATQGMSDPNQRVRVFAEWLRSLPTSAFRDGKVTDDSIERLLQALGDARRLSVGVLGANRVDELIG